MRKKVLVAAYACEPDQGSEPGVGWHMCQAISQEHEVWAITRANNKDKIERALAESPNPFLHFAYVDLPAWARFWKRGGRFVRSYYYLWQFAALRVARRMNKEIGFDYAHHVTFVNNWMFTFLALLPIPFVWGPIGANRCMPEQLVPWRWIVIKDRIRSGYQTLFRIIDPLFWFSAYRARVIVGIDDYAYSRFPMSLFLENKVFMHPAIGVEQLFGCRSNVEISSDTFVVLSMGKLLPIKGFHLAISAFARFVEQYPNAELVIVGTGNSEYYRKLTEALCISNKVRLIRWLPRKDALHEMHKADVFLYPTFEGAGMVVLEAMAHGLPVVALDYGGPKEMVRPDCGYLVPIGTKDSVIDGLALALSELAGDPVHKVSMGLAAYNRVEEKYLWADRVNQIRNWYGRLENSCGDRRVEQ